VPRSGEGETGSGDPVERDGAGVVLVGHGGRDGERSAAVSVGKGQTAGGKANGEEGLHRQRTDAHHSPESPYTLHLLVAGGSNRSPTNSGWHRLRPLRLAWHCCQSPLSPPGVLDITAFDRSPGTGPITTQLAYAVFNPCFPSAQRCSLTRGGVRLRPPIDTARERLPPPPPPPSPPCRGRLVTVAVGEAVTLCRSRQRSRGLMLAASSCSLFFFFFIPAGRLTGQRCPLAVRVGCGAPTPPPSPPHGIPAVWPLL